MRVDPGGRFATTVRLDEVKRHFPGTRDKTFLDAACVGLAPTQARTAIERFLEQAVLCPDRDASIHHIALDQARGTAVREGARLLGAREDEIALVESTTHGLNVIAAAIPFEPHQNVVLCDLGARWTVGEDGYESRSQNSWCAGRTLTGRVLITVAAGQVAFRLRSFSLGVAA